MNWSGLGTQENHISGKGQNINLLNTAKDAVNYKKVTLLWNKKSPSSGVVSGNFYFQYI